MSAVHAVNDTWFSKPDLASRLTVLKNMLDETIFEARRDATRVQDTQARALFELTAEVLTGVKRTVEHYELGEEAAFQPQDSNLTIHD